MRSHRRIGLAIVGPLVLAASLWSGSIAYAECSQAQRTAGVCQSVTTTNDGGTVTIGREESSPGTPGTAEQSSSPGASPGGSRWSPPPIREEARLGSSECQVKVQGLCRGTSPAKNPPASSTAVTPPSPPRYASELESFAPDQPGLVVEPDGWTLPTLPTNMVALASRHRQQGELLGWPVEVRFTPIAYHFDFGDGARRSTSQAGARWAERGQRQFATTATSHRYERPGRYRVSLSVDYRVEFRFEDDEFADIDGYVSRSAPTKMVDVLTVSPLLHDAD